MFSKALSFLFPEKCTFCGKYGDKICDNCIRIIEKYEVIGIEKLGKDLDFLIYFFKYEKIIRELILKYKFFNKPELSKLFSKIILKNEKICGKLKFYDIIIAVPMQRIKKDARGYNQTELFSKQIANKLDILYSANTLIKVKNNKTQSSLKLEDRVNNVKNAFEVKNESLVKNKKVILVDDIYTTGATLSECARILKEAGAETVLGLVIAKD